MGKYSEEELNRLEKAELIKIILAQEKQLASKRGQPKRDMLVGQYFGALKVVGDAGNEQGHSTWLCRCSGDIYNPEENSCCKTVRFWGSNLKIGRHQYCGNDSCPAARQLLGDRRRKNRILDEDFLVFLKSELRLKYAIAGSEAERLAKRELEKLTPIFLLYYGINPKKVAFKCEEIAKKLQTNVTKIKDYRQKIEYYLNRYQSENN